MAKKVTVGYKYFLGVQLALCHGAVDSVRRLIVGEREAWSGSISSTSEVYVDKPELFGGEKSQGGVAGIMKVSMGDEDQTPEPYLMANCAANVPAYLGLTTVLFKRFYWSAMNPYFKAPWLEVTRILKGWRGGVVFHPTKAVIGLDMNPAHIIYQSLTDVDWGMGYSTLDIDETSFIYAADKLYSESFGLSLIWEKQMPIMQFIQIICDHINGALQFDLKTGKFKLKLIRDGYDVNTLTEINPDNVVSLESFQRLGVGELANMITITYTDRNQVKQTVTVHDLAMMESQGGAITTSREYLGIRTPELASRVAMRDLATISNPLAKVSLTTNRVLFDKERGDEIAFTWPQLGITKLPMRIISIDKGTLLNGQIKVELIEDVFGLPNNSYVKPQPPIWVDPQQPPAPSSLRKIIELPYWELQRQMSPGDFSVWPNDAAAFGTMANKPNQVSYDYGIAVAPNYVDGARASFTPNALLVAAIRAGQTAITVSAGSMLGDVLVGEYALIGDEFVRIDSINYVTGALSVGRGCLDTVTRAWPKDTPVFFPQDTLGNDDVQYTKGQSVTVKMLPRTGQGELSLAAAPSDTIGFVGRAYKPYPPGQLRLSGSVKAEPSTIYPDTVTGYLTVTWKSRNRLVQNLEDESLGNITSEPNVTYNLRIYEGGTLLEQVVNTTLLQFTSAIAGTRTLRVELESVRDGEVSFTKHNHTFQLINNNYIITEEGDNLVTENGDKLTGE